MKMPSFRGTSSFKVTSSLSPIYAKTTASAFIPEFLLSSFIVDEKLVPARAWLSSSIHIFAVLDAQDQHVGIHDCKDDPVITDAKLAESSEWPGEGGELLRIKSKFRVDLVKDSRRMRLADALEILGDRLFESDVIGQGTFSYPCWK